MTDKSGATAPPKAGDPTAAPATETPDGAAPPAAETGPPGSADADLDDAAAGPVDSDDDGDDDTDTDTDGEDGRRGVLAPGAALVALLAVGWLAASLWLLRDAIATSVTDAIALASTAIALPNVVSASVVAGAAVGLTAANLAARRWPGTTVRFTAAIGASMVVGLAAAFAGSVWYGGAAGTILAGTVAAAVIVGGAAAATAVSRAAAPALAGVAAATLALFAVVLLLNVFRGALLPLLGAGESGASQQSAAGRLTLASTVLSGLVAGFVVFGYLRLVGRRSSGVPAPRWPAYMLGGAGSGLLLLVSEVVTRVGGARVLEAVSSISEVDRLVRAQADSDRIMFALMVLFIGALTATIAFGRTLKPAR
ncbi:hypothetical protein [Polymorphospora sp. NPDC050346]|uniref:hypothetical protein n=1 Tax=Polymorphospora sp. NPDC050346 TaxID=3155780 RepID=UPI0033ED6C90